MHLSKLPDLVVSVKGAGLGSTVAGDDADALVSGVCSGGASVAFSLAACWVDDRTIGAACAGSLVAAYVSVSDTFSLLFEAQVAV